MGTIVDESKVVDNIGTIDGNPRVDNSAEWLATICLADGGICTEYQGLLTECCRMLMAPYATCIQLQR